MGFACPLGSGQVGTPACLHPDQHKLFCGQLFVRKLHGKGSAQSLGWPQSAMLGPDTWVLPTVSCGSPGIALTWGSLSPWLLRAGATASICPLPDHAVPRWSVRVWERGRWPWVQSLFLPFANVATMAPGADAVIKVLLGPEIIFTHLPPLSPTPGLWFLF